MIGAIGIDTREERIIQIQAKSVILGTGQCVRLYPGVYTRLDVQPGKFSKYHR